MTTTTMERSEVRTKPRYGASVRLLRKIAVAIAGLGLLGTEFPTARRLSTRLNTHAKSAWQKLRNTATNARTIKD